MNKWPQPEKTVAPGKTVGASEVRLSLATLPLLAGSVSTTNYKELINRTLTRDYSKSNNFMKL